MELEYKRSLKELPEGIRVSLLNTNVFYTENYRQYLLSEGRDPFYIYSDEYIILVIVTKKLIFKYVDLPVECYQWNALGKSSLRHFWDKCVDLLKKDFKVHWLNHPSTSALFSEYPTKSIRIPFGSHIIDLEKSEEELWMNVHSKHRNSIRRAEKSRVIIKMGGEDLIDDFYELERKTGERSSIGSKSPEYFLNLINSLKEHCIIFVAYKDNEPQGTALLFYNKKMSYYMYGGSCESPEPGSMNLLHWEAIKFMKHIDVKEYSFVGARINEDEESKYHSIQRFKERFGGNLRECFLFKVIMDTKMYKLFCLLVKLKAKVSKTIYNGDIIDQEIHKWKDINGKKE